MKEQIVQFFNNAPAGQRIWIILVVLCVAYLINMIVKRIYTPRFRYNMVVLIAIMIAFLAINWFANWIYLRLVDGWLFLFG